MLNDAHPHLTLQSQFTKNNSSAFLSTEFTRSSVTKQPHIFIATLLNFVKKRKPLLLEKTALLTPSDEKIPKKITPVIIHFGDFLYSHNLA